MDEGKKHNNIIEVQGLCMYTYISYILYEYA